MQHAQERPDVSRADRLAFELPNDLLQLAAIAFRRIRNQALRCETLFKLRAVARGAGAVKKADETLEQRVRAAQGDKHEAIVCRRETVNAVEVFPEVRNHLNAFLVRGADREASLHLAGEVAG